MFGSVEIDVAVRGDAFGLSRRLARHRPYMVQSGSRRWIVQAQAPGDDDEPLLKAFAAIDRCLREPRVEDAEVGSGLGVRGHPDPAAALDNVYVRDR